LLSLAREGRQRPEAVEEAKELVVAHGGVEATYARAAEYARAAQEALGRVPELGGDREVLLSLPGYVLRRRH
jgi:geranylgeranyl pyrophosphate synthase